MQDKKSYSRPELKVHGSVSQITQQVKKQPTSTDQTFPSNTPFPDLTWS